MSWKSIGKIIFGIVLILLGLAALFTPFTPGSWLVFVGLEMMGIRLAIWDQIKLKLFKKNERKE